MLCCDLWWYNWSYLLFILCLCCIVWFQQVNAFTSFVKSPYLFLPHIKHKISSDFEETQPLMQIDFFFILSYLYFSRKKMYNYIYIYIYLTFLMKSLGSSSGFRLSSSRRLSPERDSHLHMDFLVLCLITLSVLLV